MENLSHNSEADAARYLAGDMSGRRRAWFSQHLLDCDECWREVRSAQDGRNRLEAARTLAPPHVRDRVRALVLASEQPLVPRSGPGPDRNLLRSWPGRGLVLGGVLALVASLLATTTLLEASSRDPVAFREAVSDFEARTLPGTRLAGASPPDLSALGLRPLGAAGGEYGGREVDGFAYRDAVGRRMVLYLSEDPFPMAPGAEPLNADGPWLSRRSGAWVLCARSPHDVLIVSDDEGLLRQAAVALRVL